VYETELVTLIRIREGSPVFTSAVVQRQIEAFPLAMVEFFEVTEHFSPEANGQEKRKHGSLIWKSAYASVLTERNTRLRRAPL